MMSGWSFGEKTRSCLGPPVLPSWHRGDRDPPTCQQVPEASWTVGERDGVAYAYTRPSPTRYPWQWYWGLALCGHRLATLRTGAVSRCPLRLRQAIGALVR